ncbi:MAG: glycine zipper 2TM domain-containing protein [Gammaproteobacteria bacterium]|nr:glycine zipper 2TM domain-containing protein [Gammaproteobacteria bacterium]MCP5423811.1 glycine zipper 2TM domain-containing protein [Gammaproteobacteria bacterium]
MTTKIAPMAAAMVCAGLLVSGCAPSLSGSAYSRSQARETQQVEFGVVEGVRNVMIEGTKTPVGTVTGAALGGLAGSTVGGGRGKAAATIGGAVLGGMAGAATEEAITRRQGFEITVRLDNGRFIAVTQEADEPFNPGDRVRVLRGYDGTTRVTH